MRVAFIANFQASKRVKPGNRALDLPTRFGQSAAMGRASFREQGSDATVAQALPMWLGTVAPVTLNDLRLVQRTAPIADKEGWPAARLPMAPAEHEIADCDRRRIERHLAETRVLSGKTLENFDFDAVPMVPRAQVRHYVPATDGCAAAPT
jgi:hypothetical protein